MFELALRIGFSLLAIMGLMWALARVIRRPLGSGRPHGQLAVLNRQQLTRGAAVAVVKVADRAIILGVTDAQVSLLGEAHIEDFERHPAEHRDHLELDAELAGAAAAGLPGARQPGARQPGGHLPGAHPAGALGRLDGSLLSPRTWRSTINILRDRTSRR